MDVHVFRNGQAAVTAVLLHDETFGHDVYPVENAPRGIVGGDVLEKVHQSLAVIVCNVLLQVGVTDAEPVHQIFVGQDVAVEQLGTQFDIF